MLKNISKIKGSKVLDKERMRKSTGGFGNNNCSSGALYCAFFNTAQRYYEIGFCVNGVCTSQSPD